MAKNRSYASIFQEAFLAMHKNNPQHAHSHPKEDWAIENFTDRVFALGYKGKADKAYKWWLDQNMQGLRPVKVSLDPLDIRFLMDALAEIHENYKEDDDGNITLFGNEYAGQFLKGLGKKLEKAADESIVGD